jgi:hypothetical protein
MAPADVLANESFEVQVRAGRAAMRPSPDRSRVKRHCSPVVSITPDGRIAGSALPSMSRCDY